MNMLSQRALTVCLLFANIWTQISQFLWRALCTGVLISP